MRLRRTYAAQSLSGTQYGLSVGNGGSCGLLPKLGNVRGWFTVDFGSSVLLCEKKDQATPSISGNTLGEISTCMIFNVRSLGCLKMNGGMVSITSSNVLIFTVIVVKLVNFVKSLNACIESGNFFFWYSSSSTRRFVKVEKELNSSSPFLLRRSAGNFLHRRLVSLVHFQIWLSA